MGLVHWGDQHSEAFSTLLLTCCRCIVRGVRSIFRGRRHHTSDHEAAISRRGLPSASPSPSDTHPTSSLERVSLFARLLCLFSGSMATCFCLSILCAYPLLTFAGVLSPMNRIDLSARELCRESMVAIPFVSVAHVAVPSHSFIMWIIN